MNLRDLLMQAAGMNKPQVPQGEAPAMFNNGVRPQNNVKPAQYAGIAAADANEVGPVSVSYRRGLGQFGNVASQPAEYQVQPFGPRYEDDFTQTQQLQPVDYNNRQVSLNGNLMQGSSLRDYIRLSNY